MEAKEDWLDDGCIVSGTLDAVKPDGLRAGRWSDSYLMKAFIGLKKINRKIDERFPLQVTFINPVMQFKRTRLTTESMPIYPFKN